MSDEPVRSDALVLFGATGDLAVKKIFPAVYEMAKNGTLGDGPVIGVASRGWTVDQLREHARDAIAARTDIDETVWADLAPRISYVSGDYREDVHLRAPGRGRRRSPAPALLPGDSARRSSTTSSRASRR